MQNGPVMRRSSCLLLMLLSFLLLRPAARAEEEWMFDPTFREGSGSDVLLEGPPPLLRAQLDGFVDLMEAAFALALAPDAEQALRDAYETWYAKSTETERVAFATLVAPRTALAAAARRGEAGVLDEGLQAFRRALDQRLSAAPGIVPHRLVRDLLVERQATPWPGMPPVHAPAAAAWLEMVEFLVSLARNEDFEPTTGQVEALGRELAAPLHGLDLPIRTRLRDVYRTWLRLEADWDRADVGRRLALRWKALDLLARALPPERRIAVGKPGDLQTYARAAAALARTQSGYEAWSNFARQPAAVFEIVDAWLGPLPASRDHVLLYR
jgi:hypothetical protein